MREKEKKKAMGGKRLKFMSSSLRCPLSNRVTAVVEEVTKTKIEPHVNHLILELCCDDEQGEDAEVPYVLYKLK